MSFASALSPVNWNGIELTPALATFRRSGILAAPMMFEHARPLQEECLWYADIVAGAVLAGLRGDSRYRKPLDGWLREVRLELR